MRSDHHPSTTRRRGRLRGLLAAAGALGAGLVVAAASPAAPASAATEVILPPSEIELVNSEHFGNSGDLPMPSCGSANINGDKGFARWTIKSSLGANSIVFPGTEWDVTVEMYADNLDSDQWSYNDGPDPLIVSMPPAGPVERVQILPTLPANLGVHSAYHGDSWVGPKNAIQTWGYAFDSNSEPTLDGILIETSDGVDLSLKIRVRATGPGVVSLPSLNITGWDSTPKAASVNCSVPIGWTWGVAAFDPPIVKGESVKTDASYTNLLPDDADDDDVNFGGHGISINVLANDDDANTPGGVGNTDQVRLESWQLNSANGGNVNCGTLLANAEDAPFGDLSTGPCTYYPAEGFEGIDTFNYTVRQASDGSTASGTVKVNVVRNRRPLTATAELYATNNVDETIDVRGYSVDPDGDPVTCLPDLVSGPDLAIGTITMNANCTFDWDSTGGQGVVDFTYRVCDTHPLLGEHGPNAVKAGGYATGDLSATTSRRCTDAAVELLVGSGILIAPTGVPDVDVVDAGYSGDAIGPYSIEVPVFENDTDNNGPGGEAGLEGLLVLTPEAEIPGTVVVDDVAETLTFTPDDGFEGPVVIKYRVCEDPDQQDPTYDGFGICGGGLLKIEVVANPVPVAADDFAVAVAPNGTIVDRDLAANDVDPEGEALTCETTLVGVDPAFIASATLGADCLLDVDPVDGITGSTSFAYTVCDTHPLSQPLWPTSPYGTDGRSPGDLTSRCSTAEVEVFIIQPLVIDPETPPQVDDGPEGQPDEPPAPDTTVPPPGDPGVPPTTVSPEAPVTGELPATGGNSTGMMVLAGGLLVAGLASLGIARRRRA